MGDRASDVEALRQLPHRYCDALVRRDWDDFGRLFAPDAVWHIPEPFNIHAVGRDEIVAIVAAAFEGLAFHVQTIGIFVIDTVDAERARMRTTVHEVARQLDGTGILLFGVYDDECVRLGSEWRFKSRTLQLLYTDSPALPGAVYSVPRFSVG
jgi:uncharacterized protein (TIGR02246 family)